jgi:hypothetical protein
MWRKCFLDSAIGLENDRAVAFLISIPAYCEVDIGGPCRVARDTQEGDPYESGGARVHSRMQSVAYVKIASAPLGRTRSSWAQAF